MGLLQKVLVLGCIPLGAWGVSRLLRPAGLAPGAAGGRAVLPGPAPRLRRAGPGPAGRAGGLRRRARGSSPGWPGPAGCRPSPRPRRPSGWRSTLSGQVLALGRRRGGGGGLRPGGGGGGRGLRAGRRGRLAPGGRVAGQRAGAGRGRRGHRGGRRALRALGGRHAAGRPLRPWRSSAWPGRRPRPVVERPAPLRRRPGRHQRPQLAAGRRGRPAAAHRPPVPPGLGRPVVGGGRAAPGCWPWPWPGAGRAASPPRSTCCWPRPPPPWPPGWASGWRPSRSTWPATASAGARWPPGRPRGRGGGAGAGGGRRRRRPVGPGRHRLRPRPSPRCRGGRAGAGGYRVLWLGDPRALPVGAWSVSAGLAYATSEVTTPDARDLWAPASPGPAADAGRGRAPGPAGPDRPPGPAAGPRRRPLRGGGRGARPPDPRRPDIAGDAAARPACLTSLHQQSDLAQVSTSVGGLVVFENTTGLPQRAERTRPLPATAGRPAGWPTAQDVTGWRPVLPGPAGAALLQRDGGLGHRLRRLRPGRPLAGPRPRPHGGLDAGLRLGGAVRNVPAGPATLRLGLTPLVPLAVIAELLLWLAVAGTLLGRRRWLDWWVGAGRRPPGPQGGRRGAAEPRASVDPPAGGAVPAADAGRSPSGAAP